MPRWTGCTVEVRSADDETPFVDDDCDVHLEEGRLLVSYFDEDGPVVFTAPADRDPHFQGTCRSRPRVGTLEMSADRSELRGSWLEHAVEGYWRITLGRRAGSEE